MPLSNMDSFNATSCGCIHYDRLYRTYVHLYRIHYGHLCRALYDLIIMDSAIYFAVYNLYNLYYNIIR